MLINRKYELIILLNDEFNEGALKRWVVKYAKTLRKFNACAISVASIANQNLAYPIQNKLIGNYIQVNFSTMPKYIESFLNILKMDSNVLRVLVTKK